MRKSLLLLFGLIWLLSSCKSINLNQVSRTKTKQQVHLGSIGSRKDFILQNGYNTTAIPLYKEPIKIMVIPMPFSKQSYKAFMKAKALQFADVSVNYIDSIVEKPKYLKLQIADKVEVITALNSEENKNVKELISHNTYTNILTSISIAMNQKQIESVMSADAVFLIEKGLKTYVLQLYKDAVKTQTIQFNEGVIFEYSASNCCWQQNKTHRLNIVDLVDKYNECPNGTFRSLKRANKTENYYKL